MRLWKVSSSNSPGEDEDGGSRVRGNAMIWELSATSFSDVRESEMATQSASAVPPLGELLRYWIQECGKS